MIILAITRGTHPNDGRIAGRQPELVRRIGGKDRRGHVGVRDVEHNVAAQEIPCIVQIGRVPIAVEIGFDSQLRTAVVFTGRGCTGLATPSVPKTKNQHGSPSTGMFAPQRGRSRPTSAGGLLGKNSHLSDFRLKIDKRHVGVVQLGQPTELRQQIVGDESPQLPLLVRVSSHHQPFLPLCSNRVRPPCYRGHRRDGNSHR